MLTCKLVGCMHFYVTLGAKCSLVRTTNDRGWSFLTYVALNFHPPSSGDLEIEILLWMHHTCQKGAWKQTIFKEIVSQTSKIDVSDKPFQKTGKRDPFRPTRLQEWRKVSLEDKQ
uniref:Uncharacterized protein MANES_11G122000 n=1 Tax=Rhizophora mucronata TaxID=61149 RepID=A0A2P2KRQ9_RHIMU